MHAAPPPVAIVQRITVRADSLTFVFDRRPQRVTVKWIPRAQLHDCASDHVVRLPGRAFAAIHFFPAQSARRMGPYRTAAKLCDFESDLAWAVGRAAKERVRIARDGPAVTISFG
jgi:hypothetical protein